MLQILGYRKPSVKFQYWFRQKSVHECVMPLLHLEHDHMICNLARPLPRIFQPKARFDPIYEKLTNYIYQDQTINIPSVSWIGLQLNLLSRLKPLRILARLRIWWLDRGLREACIITRISKVLLNTRQFWEDRLARSDGSLRNQFGEELFVEKNENHVFEWFCVRWHVYFYDWVWMIGVGWDHAPTKQEASSS